MIKILLPISCLLLSIAGCETQKQVLNEKQIKSIDSLFSKWDNNNSAGMSVAIWHKDNLTTLNYGMSDIEKQIPITDDTKFDIASMSKQFTIMSILLLEEEGKLSVNDDIRKYLPELPDYGEKVTIDNLMTHTSGIRDHFLLLQLTNDCGSDTTITNRDILTLISRQNELSFKPGSQQIYCNSGYVLLAIIIERISKMSFPEFTYKYIFEPLGMMNSYFIDSKTYLSENCAKGYLYNEKDTAFNYIPNYATVSGGTGMTTTASDLVKWYLNFKNNKLGKRKQSLIDKLTRIPKINNYIPFKRGYGMYVDNYNNSLNYWMTGDEIGYSSVMTYFPEQDFIAVVLSNISREIDFNNRYDISNFFVKNNKTKDTSFISDNEQKKKNKHLHTPEELMSLQGKYFDPKELDMEFIRYRDTSLYTYRGTELIPIGKYQFKLKGQKNTFSFKKINDSTIYLKTQQYSYGDDYEYDYPLRESNLKKQSESIINTGNAHDLTGSYKNEGTHKAININLGNTGLSARWEGGGSFELQPIFNNYLLSFSRYAFFEIDYNEDNSIKGFYISYDRMRNLYFKKE